MLGEDCCSCAARHAGNDNPDGQILRSAAGNLTGSYYSFLKTPVVLWHSRHVTIAFDRREVQPFPVVPQFAFGHRLSYTTFAYSDLNVTPLAKGATLTFRLTNTGKMTGSEVAQVYVHQQKSTLPRPEKELKGFQKIFLKPGETKLVTIKLDEAAFSYYSDVRNNWVLEPGSFQLLVGASSDDIRLEKTVTIK